MAALGAVRNSGLEVVRVAHALTFGVALALVSPRVACAQAADPGDSLFAGQSPAPSLALSVADLDRELAWYRDVMGFRVYSQGRLTDRIQYALLLQGNVLLELLQVDGAHPRRPAATDPSQTLGFFKGGLVVADIERLYRALQARGAVFLFPLSRPPIGPYRAFGIRDPEGNILQFLGW